MVVDFERKVATISGLLLAIVVALMCVISSNQLAEANPPNILPLKDFKELSLSAKKIESAELLANDKRTAAKMQQRRELLYLFARETKSIHCDRYYQKMERSATDFKLKAYEFVEEDKRGKKNWFMNVVTFGGNIGPLGGMRGISRSDSDLESITKRYESQANKRLLSINDVDCDILKYQIKNIKEIVFVLQTDIKYLIVEDQQLLNRAIYEQLKSDKYKSKTNYYELHELIPQQKELLLGLFASHVNHEKITIGQAVDHFYDPGAYIVGRLFDSCNSVVQYQKIWSDLDSKRLDVCSKSKSDPNGKLFDNRFRQKDFEDTFAFCHNFLEAL